MSRSKTPYGERERMLDAGFSKATTDFVSDMQQLLSPERVKAIWAGKPDPWDERKDDDRKD